MIPSFTIYLFSPLPRSRWRGIRQLQHLYRDQHRCCHRPPGEAAAACTSSYISTHTHTHTYTHACTHTHPHKPGPLPPLPTLHFQMQTSGIQASGGLPSSSSFHSGGEAGEGRGRERAEGRERGERERERDRFYSPAPRADATRAYQTSSSCRAGHVGPWWGGERAQE